MPRLWVGGPPSPARLAPLVWRARPPAAGARARPRHRTWLGSRAPAVLQCRRPGARRGVWPAPPARRPPQRGAAPGARGAPRGLASTCPTRTHARTHTHSGTLTRTNTLTLRHASHPHPAHPPPTPPAEDHVSPAGRRRRPGIPARPQHRARRPQGAARARGVRTPGKKSTPARGPLRSCGRRRACVWHAWARATAARLALSLPLARKRYRFPLRRLSLRRLFRPPPQASNVLLAADPDAPFGVAARLSDFGLSRALAAGQTHASTRTVGTVTHCAVRRRPRRGQEAEALARAARRGAGAGARRGGFGCGPQPLAPSRAPHPHRTPAASPPPPVPNSPSCS
jgi:hypothetical protein